MAFARAYGFDTLDVAREAGWAATVSASNTVGVSATAARTGGGGVLITRGSAAGLVYFGIGTSSLPPVPSHAQCWYGIGIRFSALPALLDTVVLRVGTGAGVSAYVSVDASGNVRCQIQGGSQSAIVATLTTNTWYWIEILHDVSGTTHSVKVRVDGGTEQTATRSGQSATTSRFNVIGTDVAGGGAYTMHADDLVIHTATTTFQGRRKVLRLRPNADVSGSYTITGGGTDRWAAVDDVTPDDATTYLTANASNAVQVLGLETYTLVSGETFEGVSAFGRVGSTGTTGTRTLAVSLQSGGGTNGTASTWAAAINGWQASSVGRDDVDVPGGSGLSQSDVDNLRLRMTGSVNTVRVTSIHLYVSVVIDTTPPVLNVTAGPTPARISAQAGFDSLSITFSPNEALGAWELRSVAAAGDARNTGSQPLVKSGGSVAAAASVPVTVTHADLAAAGVGAPPDGTRLLKFFGQDLANLWSA